MKMFNAAKKYGRQLAVVAGAAALAAPAFATTTTSYFDATSYASTVTSTIAGILAVGGAVFGVYVAIKSTKWGRRAL